MENASHQCVAMDINIPTEQKQPPLSPLAFVVSPIWKLNPGNDNNHSNLYDSYELQAVTKQLKRAIRGSKSPLSPYSYYMESSSPFYSKRLNCIFRHNATTAKRICHPQLNGATVDLKTNAKGTRGIVFRLWKKIKNKITRRSDAIN